MPEYDTTEQLTKDGTVFRVHFVNGDVETVRGEVYMTHALIKAFSQYLQKHPQAVPEDLMAEAVRYHNGKQWIYVLRDTRFTLGVR